MLAFRRILTGMSTCVRRHRFLRQPRASVGAADILLRADANRDARALGPQRLGRLQRLHVAAGPTAAGPAAQLLCGGGRPAAVVTALRAGPLRHPRAVEILATRPCHG